MDTALSLLKIQYPGFLLSIANQKILDFGCGQGYQSLALGAAGARQVIGIDINKQHLANAGELARQFGIADQVKFVEPFELDGYGLFDVVLAYNSMEHFNEPDVILKEMTSRLTPQGRLFISFGPPWYSPYGAHTNFFCKVPWIHLIFSEKSVMSVRTNFTDDGATRYEDVRGGLNKMSLARFQKLVADGGLEMEYCKYRYVLGLTFLEKLPLLRELMIYYISVILKPRVTSYSS
jgi:SAM-dependent methyltransferase